MTFQPRTHSKKASSSASTGVPAVVHDVLRSPGRPLSPSTRDSMEQRFTRSLPGTHALSPVRPDADPVNHPNDRYEREAGQTVRQLARDGAATSASGPTSNSSFDFSQVRVHTGPNAQASTRALSAQAYTLGNHIVVGSASSSLDRPGDSGLLAHELTHVVQQRKATDREEGSIQRAGLFENIARLFGGGSFSTEELNLYLTILEGGQQIEDDFDSDNKARAVVEEGMHRSQSVFIRSLLIQEMLSGFTGNDDEEAILTILDEASPMEKERLVELVGRDVLIENFHGDQSDRLYGILAGIQRGRSEPISSSWDFSYETRGAERLRGPNQPMTVNTFSVQPTDASEEIPVASNVQNETGRPVSMNPAVEHPRDVGGLGFLSLDAGIPSTAEVPIRLRGEYAPLTRDRRHVTAHLNVTFGTEEVGQSGTSEARQRSRTTSREEGTRRSETTGQAETESRGVTRDARQSVTASADVTRGRSVTDERGISQTTETEVSLTGTMTQELRGSISLGGELQVGADALASLLLLAGPQGAALFGLLEGLGVLDSTHFTVTANGELGFSLQVSLSASVARRWSETRSRMISATASESRRVGASAGIERGRSESRGSSETRSSEQTHEHFEAETQARTTGRTDTTSQTEGQFVPVVDDAEMDLRVDER